MESIQQLAAGNFPVEFPFQYKSEFDPSSPWSLCLAFFPETSSFSHIDFPSLVSPESDRVPLNAAIASYVEAITARLGWSKEELGTESINELFLKTRLRQTDEACRQMDVPASVHPGDSRWVDGIVRVLQLYRRFSGDHDEDMTVTDFEKAAVEQNFARLIAVRPPQWDLRQRLEFLVMPYLSFTNRVDLAQHYIVTQDLSDVMPVFYVPELISSVLRVCLNSPTEEWQNVKKIAENVTPQAGLDGEIKDVNSLTQPSRESLKLLQNLAEAAQLDKFPHVLFEQLAEWALSPGSTQEDLLVRFLHSSAHFTQNEINLLRKSVFQNIDDLVIARECIKSSLDQSRFMFIKTNLLKPEFMKIVSEEILNLVKSFEEHPKTADLTKVLTALDLIDERHNPDVSQLKAKFAGLNKIYKTFAVEPAFALTHTPLENVSQALKSDSQAYVRYTDLVNLVGGGPANGSAVAERCVEAALADDNFSVAVEFFDRKFVDPEKSDSAWLAYYQAGKYLSPDWDIPRPKPILKRQRELLSSALLLCKESDLVPVLRSWTAVDTELQSYSGDTPEASANTSTVKQSSHDASLLQAASRSQSPAAHINVDSAKDQLSNIFKSGIGWVVGANPP